MKLDGLVSIGRISNMAGQGRIEILIEDKKSGIEFVKASISYEEFAQALTGLAMRPASLELRGLEKIGCARETKTMGIFVPTHDYKDRDAVTRKAVSDAESDGWTGYVSDAQNHNRITKRNDDGVFHNVAFQRWVKEGKS